MRRALLALLALVLLVAHVDAAQLPSPTFYSLSLQNPPKVACTGYLFANGINSPATCLAGSSGGITVGATISGTCPNSYVLYSNSGVVGCIASGSGLPAGTNGQLQYNNSGAFGGLTIGGDATLVASTGVLTVTKTSGTAFGALATLTPGANVATALGIAPLTTGSFTRQNGAIGNLDCLNWSSSSGITDAGAQCFSLLTLPATASGTANSGGVLYLSTSTQISSSAALAANSLLIGGGPGVAPSSTTTGANVLTALAAAIDANSGGLTITSGSMTTGHCLQWGPGIADAGAGCAGTFTFPATIAGTANSGGVPYFSNSTTLASSAALAANQLVVGGGAGAAPSTVTTAASALTALGTATGSAGGFATISGSVTNGHCVSWGASGVLLDAGGACTTGGGGGTVSSGTSGQIAYYSATGTTVAGTTTGAHVLTAIGNAIDANSGGLTITSGSLTTNDCLKWGPGIADAGAACGSSITFPQTVASGVSGGIPYFSATTTMSASALLAANALMVGGGAGAAPSTITTGANVVTALGVTIDANSGGLTITSGSLTTGHCLQWGPGIADSGGACGSAAVSSISNSDGTLTISPTTGAAVASIALSHANTWSGAQTYGNGDFKLAGSTSGTTIINAAATASGTLTAQAVTDTLAVLGTNQTFSAVQTFSGTLTASGTLNVSGTFQSNGNTMTFPSAVATLAALNVTDQVLSGGANVSTVSNAAGNITVDCGQGPIQYIPSRTSAWTITAPSNDGSCVLQVENPASGTLIAPSFSGFLEGSNTGDTITTTNSSIFQVVITRAHGFSHYLVTALQ
jgi:hypothetical protein